MYRNRQQDGDLKGTRKMAKFPKRTINKIYKIIKLEAKKKNSNKKIGKRLKVINKFLLKILNMKI